MKRVQLIILSVAVLAILFFLAGNTPQIGTPVFSWFAKFKNNYPDSEKIISGWSEWLFFKPEIEYLFKGTHAGNVDDIVRFGRILREKGITLYFVPVPHKLDLYPEKLLPVAVLRPVNSARANTISQLRASGVLVIDLLDEFEKQKSRMEIFEAHDSHWTPRGIELSAKIVARAIDTALTSRGIPRSARFSANDTMLYFHGDLRDRLSKDSATHWYLLPVPQVRDSANATFEDFRQSDVLILGDSFVDRARWVSAHFGAQLARFIGYPTRTYFSLLSNTDGSCLCDRRPELFPKNGVVIWVCASRVLQYEMCSPK